ncbi:alkaline phosphatase family protein [Amycolatopsis sp.]|uniref:alkaline phosphatase family protein n=1 Tax=Amycolatopsis sp. TaxID=37632 RepID=UPI002CE4F4B8|nr:alkaline phosphatase family protein [Amycolatopsis sp.]HVV10435.1 alkaline phosphatase family protein [Amycolatopsis sp.]
MVSRRTALATGVGAAGLAAVAALLPPNLRKVMGSGVKPAGIEHVVVLTQENRSFDHYFGTLSGVRGFDDPDALTLPSGRSVFHQPDERNPDGYLLPFHLDTKRTSAQAIPSTSHAFSVQHDACHDGRMDRWVPAHRASDGDEHGPYTMGYYTRDDIPFHFALAEAFTVCDAYHCSVLGPTWPNRLYLWSGGIDPGGAAGGPVTSNVVPSPYRWKTYPERLTEAGVSWHVYQEEDDYGCNPLEFFQSYQDAGTDSPLYQHGMAIGPADQFERDAREDRLPTVSWIVPTGAQCEHPDYLPAAGADFVARKLDAVAANPDVWRKTVFILNYDENDGLFDHVPPPLPGRGTDGEFVGGVPIGAGFRVPCLIVSPWTQGGWVARERFDHTSVLRFLEQVTGVAEPNLTGWRRETFGDLLSALGMPSGAPFPALPSVNVADAERAVATLPPAVVPGARQAPPHQEPGGRKTTAAYVRPGTRSRVAETLTTHRFDFPDGVVGTNFPGIPLAAATAGPPAAAPGRVYVAGITGFQLLVLDGASFSLLHAVVAGPNPYGVATDGTRIFVTNSGAADVSVFDPATNTMTGRIAVGAGPHGITVSDQEVFVANTGAGTVSVLGSGEIEVGAAPQSVAVVGSTLYASCADGLSIVDLETRRVRARLPELARARGLGLSPDGARLYVTLPDENTVAVVLRGKVTDRIAVGRAPWQVTFRPDGAFAYVCNANDDTISVLDPASGTVAATIAVGHVPTGVHATGGILWVSTNASCTVQAVDLASRRVLATVPVGLSTQPAGIAVL